MEGYWLERQKGALEKGRIATLDMEAGKDGILCRIDSAAVTSNNLTYAVHGGPPLNYWRFFPSSDPDWGIVPLWGTATVVESRHPDVAVGRRLFGYWPSGSHLAITPGAIGESGLTDMAPHRQEQAAVYNRYRWADDFDQQTEELMALFQPLYGTAFVLAAMLRQTAADCLVLITSASSKTALGTGYALRQAGGPQSVGITSSSHKGFVETTGYYDQVLDYESIGKLDPERPTVLVDVAGNGAVTAQVHAHVKALMASHMVGGTHWNAPQMATTLPGPAPSMFFAPTWWEARAREIGPAAFDAELGASLKAFLVSTRPWLTIEETHGPDGYARDFEALLNGDTRPSHGIIWKPR